MKKILLFIFLFLNAAPSHAMVFNNVPFSNKELINQIEESYASGINSGFGGFKQYTITDLIQIYSKSEDPYIHRYIKEDLLEVESKGDGFSIEPIKSIGLRIYNYAGDIPAGERYCLEYREGNCVRWDFISLMLYGREYMPDKERYCLENMEGNCINKNFNGFININGQARLKSNITLFYEVENKLSGKTGISFLKKGYSKFKLWVFEIEAGKDSLWLGHGAHGSLLLSSNAEPFWQLKITTDSLAPPGFLSILGEFKYMLFHGWTDFNILGHRFGWKPFNILEIGLTQTVMYNKEKSYNILEWPKMFFASEENVPSRYNNDQRASMDIALYLPFLSRLPWIQGGKIYWEYAGEDLYAFWQDEDKQYKDFGPIGFEFLASAYMLGFMLTTGDTDFRWEYSENYRSYPVFYDWYTDRNISPIGHGEAWYMQIPFMVDDVIMGHHMGRMAEDKFMEVRHRWKDLRAAVYYDNERHYQLYRNRYDGSIEKTSVESRDQYGLDIIYLFKEIELSGTIILNRYENVDGDPSPLGANIIEGKNGEELITGIGIRYVW
jgi:hypothetical protein